MSGDASDKKIIIDEDWKEEAQREKETLARALEKERKEKQRPPETASLPLLVSSLATQAMMDLGLVENPFSKKTEVNLPHAQFHIDMIEVLQQKTKGNLTPDEERMIESILFDLRMQFVEMAK